MKFVGTVDAVTDICFMVLLSVHKPADIVSVPLHAIHVVCRNIGGRIAAIARVISVMIFPVYGAVYFGGSIDVLHDVYFPAFGPPYRRNAVTEHPESRPGTQGGGHGYTGFYFSVFKRFLSLCFHAGRSVVISVEALLLCRNDQGTVFYGSILRTIVLEFVITPAITAVTGLENPVRTDTACKFVLPYQLPVVIGSIVRCGMIPETYHYFLRVWCVYGRGIIPYVVIGKAVGKIVYADPLLMPELGIMVARRLEVVLRIVGPVLLSDIGVEISITCLFRAAQI